MPDAALAAATVLPIILLAAWLPGRLALSHFDPWRLRPVERHFAALSLGLALVGWLAFALAELGAFSLGLLALLWLLAVAGLVFVWRKSPHSSPLRFNTGDRLEAAMLLVWLPAALWLFLRPHEAILGGADAGVYVSTAAHIAREGSIFVHDATLSTMDPALQAAVLRPIPDGTITPAYLFPGFNVAGAQAGTIVPDFFHLHPTWQAVAYALGGLWGGAVTATRAALLMPGLWALLGTVAIYLALRQTLAGHEALIGRRLPAMAAVALALAALSLNAIQVWFARYPVTESLTQYLLWTGLWALGAWLTQRRQLALWGLLAGLALGMVLLARIDTLFILAIPVLIAAWQIGQRNLRRIHMWFYLPLALLALHSMLHGAFISRSYFDRIMDYGRLLLGRIGLLLPLLLGAALLAFWILLRYGKVLWRPRTRRPLLVLFAVAILALAAYGWFLRPVYGALPSYSEWYDGQTIVITDRENLVRLGWYLAPLGVWLGVAGAVVMLWRNNRRTVLILGVGLFFSLLYLWRIQANPHQIYVMRRYVPMVMPFFVVAATYLFHALFIALRGRHAGPAGSRHDLLPLAGGILTALLAVAWLAGILWSARGFVSQVDYRGLTKQLAGLAQRLPDNSVLLFDDQSPITAGDALGTPLHFIFGQDVYSLRDRAALDDATLVRSIQSWQNNGRAVYWVGAPEWLQEQGLGYQGDEVTITTSALEGSYDHKPYRIIPLTWSLTLNLIEDQ